MKITTDRPCLSIGFCFAATRFTRYVVVSFHLRGSRGPGMHFVVHGGDEYLVESLFWKPDLKGNRAFRLNQGVLA